MSRHKAGTQSHAQSAARAVRAVHGKALTTRYQAPPVAISLGTHLPRYLHKGVGCLGDRDAPRRLAAPVVRSGGRHWDRPSA